MELTQEQKLILENRDLRAALDQLSIAAEGFDALLDDDSRSQTYAEELAEMSKAQAQARALLFGRRESERLVKVSEIEAAARQIDSKEISFGYHTASGYWHWTDHGAVKHSGFKTWWEAALAAGDSPILNHED